MQLLDLFLKHRNISTDTRKLSQGDLFFALRGDNFNGNDYATKAIEFGASYAVVDDPNLKGHPRIIVVEDTLSSLQQLATAYRDYLAKPVIALTGSNGKTTTKELINSVLSQKYKVCTTKGNLNNHIGVPLSLLSAREDDDFLLIEMGANHQGEIDLLSHIAKPNYGLITNIGKAHLEGFGGIEGVKKGKSELYRYLSLNKGVIFCNEEDKMLTELLPSGIEVVYYKNDFSIDRNATTLILEKKELNIVTNLFGAHNYPNVLAAICIGKYFNISMDVIKKGIESYVPTNNRSQTEQMNGLTVIKDAYNSNPSSLKASLQSLFKAYDNTKTVVILGDMLELGEFSMYEHQQIIEFVDQYNLLDVIYIGENFSRCKSKYMKSKFFTTVAEAQSQFNLANYPKTSILFLKGSRGIAVEKLLS
jgi:UDP-N-acetylmuramoyl-tripeptide--D-alanyl-D-alanine ligase